MKKFIKHSAFRFLVVGSVNTVSTYVLYWLLLRVLDYREAYTVSFIFGLCLGYFMNSVWVFGKKPMARSAVVYSVAVLAQYAIGVVLLSLFVEWFGIAKRIAPILVVIVMFPIMYFVMEYIFSRSVTNNE